MIQGIVDRKFDDNDWGLLQNPHCGDKTEEKNRMIGNYGISKDNSHNINYLYPVYHFRYRWFKN